MTARRRARTALVGLCCLLLALVGALVAPTPPAEAASGLALTGRGFGHGIGMSQYGARYRAEAGYFYGQILSFYYPGTKLAHGSDSGTIRVRIESDGDNVTTVQSEPGLKIRSSSGTVTLPSTVGGAKPTHWRIRISSNKLVVEAKVSGKWRSSGSSAIADVLAGRDYAQFVDTDGTVRLVLGSVYREYVGAVRGVRPSGTSSTLKTVVVSTYANYLPSVVASEMPTSWHVHALRAQAAAARTYAMFDAAAKPSSSYYDTCDTTSCQVFHGRADYTASGALTRTWANAAAVSAVNVSAGRYLSYQGAPAFTQFSASNGGYSVAGSRPYLQARPDPYDRYAAWDATISAASLRSAYPGIGSFVGVDIARDGRGAYGGRVSSITIIGTSGSQTVTGSQFRFTFGLRSNLFQAVVTGGAGTKDFDSDGFADVIGITGAGRAYLWHGGGDPWAGTTRLGGAWTGKTQVTTVVDLAGSGYPEIIAIEPGGATLAAYPVTPSGSLASRRVVAVAQGPSWNRYDLFMGVVGFDGDGRPGLLARGITTGNLYYFPSDNSGGLGARQLVTRGWSDKELATVAGDWTGDGDPDLIVLDDDGKLWIYPGSGSGGLETRRLMHGTGAWGSRTSMTGGADWDNDGDLDLISVTGTGVMYLNSRTGTYSIATGQRIDSGWNQDLLP